MAWFLIGEISNLNPLAPRQVLVGGGLGNTPVFRATQDYSESFKPEKAALIITQSYLHGDGNSRRVSCKRERQLFRIEPIWDAGDPEGVVFDILVKPIGKIYNQSNWSCRVEHWV